MNGQLFNNLYFLLSDAFSPDTITEEEFFYYLIGFYSVSSKETDEYDSLSNHNYKDYISGRKNLCESLEDIYFKILDRNKNLSLKDLVNIRFEYEPKVARQTKEKILSKETEIRHLYEIYSLNSPDKNVESLLLHLFHVCISDKEIPVHIKGQKEYLFASCKNQQFKFATIKATLGRKNDSINLKKSLNTHHKIIISDQYGSGKSHFIKYCLSTWKIDDYFYVYYEYNLKNTLRKIEYRNKNFKYFSDLAIDLKSETYSSSLLIIDNMCISENLSDELEELLNYTINIIVITTLPSDHNGFYNFKMTPLSDEQLKQIFLNTSGFSNVSEYLFNRLLYITNHNILMISLIAKQCKKIHKTSSNFLDSSLVTNEVLSKLQSRNNHMDFKEMKNNRYKHNYDKKELDLIGHIKSIYNVILDGNSNDSLRKCMKYISGFGCSPIPKLFLVKTLPLSKTNHLLDALSKKGLLQQSDEYIQLSPLLSHAVFATENPSPNCQEYDDLVKRIIDFLKTYEQMLDVPFLSDTLFIFVDIFYGRVARINNSIQDTVSKRFEIWQDLLYQIHHYYKQCGMFFLAEEITLLIQYPNSEHKHNPLDKFFLNLSNKLQYGRNAEAVLKSKNDFFSFICQDPISLKNWSTSYLYESILDQIIDHISAIFLSYFKEGTLPNEYINNIMECMEKILKHAIEEKNTSRQSISSEKLEYYLQFYNLIKTPKNSIDSFTKVFSTIKTYWKNINCQICAISYVIVIQSLYVYSHGCITASLFQSHYIPMVEYLHNQINKCKLITFSTFHLCFYSYICAGIIQYSLFVKDKDTRQSFSPIFNLRNIMELADRSLLQKEDISPILNKMSDVITLLL